MPRPNTSPATLRRILQQELTLGLRLMELAENETEAIINQNVSRLIEIGCEQRLCADQQAKLEEARLTATRELAGAWGMEDVPTLSGLLPCLSPRDQTSLQKLRVRLLETQSGLSTLHARNLSLLDCALDYVRFSLETLTSAALKPARYGTNLAHLSAPTFYIDSKA